MCVNCDVLPHMVDLFPGLVCVSVVTTHCQPVSGSCMSIIVLCDHTFNIFPRFVGASFVLHYTYLQPDSGSCMCLMSSHKDDLFCVSITMLFVFTDRKKSYNNI